MSLTERMSLIGKRCRVLPSDQSDHRDLVGSAVYPKAVWIPSMNPDLTVYSDGWELFYHYELEEDMAQVEPAEGLGCVYIAQPQGVDSLLGLSDVERDHIGTVPDDAPVHWSQGPMDIERYTSGPLPPPPEPTKPAPTPPRPTLQGYRTITHLNLRKGPGLEYEIITVLRPFTIVRRTETAMRGPWIEVETQHGQIGWCHSGYLSPVRRDYSQLLRRFSDSMKKDMTREELRDEASKAANLDYYALDLEEGMPPATHVFRWYWDGVQSGTGIPDEEAMGKTDKLLTDSRGWIGGGLKWERVESPQSAQIMFRYVRSACGGAPACYRWSSGETPVIELGAQDYGTQYEARRSQHEGGHGSGRLEDRYTGAPRFPSDNYPGVMGNIRDKDNTLHFWPARFEHLDLALWLRGEAPYVVRR